VGLILVMPEEAHLALLSNGVEAWNGWRAANPLIRPNLAEADLAYRELGGINLHECTLTKADFTDTDLGRADLSAADADEACFRSADLRGATLAGGSFNCGTFLGANLGCAQLNSASCADADFAAADLSGADLSDTDLSRADLIGSDLRFARLQRATLHRTDFYDAMFGDSSIAECDLGDSKDLEFAEHRGPSSIDLSTIYKSGANIPEEFLRGCGVPETFIAQMHSLVGAEGLNRFYSCFISYSFKDEGFVRRLYSRMRDAHLRVWCAQEDAQSGKKLYEQIDTAITRYDKVLIVLSESSLQSEWVRTELRKAFKLERQSGKRKLFPISLVNFDIIRQWECFDADSGKDLGVELREYFIPDFSGWDESWRFEAAFSRLLNDLRNDETVA
jgi:uncharacterized protein YjbI with pentapeptide repeats